MKKSKSFEKAQERLRATLGRNVRELRVALDMTQSKLADRAKVRRALISDIERGEANATLGSLVRIAVVLGVDPTALFKARG